jgi:rhodanese-related sulfurtransferase
MKLGIIILAGVVLVGIGVYFITKSGEATVQQSTTAQFRVVQPREAQALLRDREEIQVLDVRTADEVATGAITGSKNIDFYASTFREQLQNLDKQVPYMVICRSGNRSGQVVTIMKSLGFSEVFDVQGGTTSWLAAGLPLR